MRYEKKKYNPGFVDYYQKPWFKSYCGNISYYGRFCEKGYPDKIHLDFKPLLQLIEKANISDKELLDEILDLIEEMKDAYYRGESKWISTLPEA